MAAQVEVQTGEVARTVAGGRLHLSPLTDSINKNLIEIPSISESTINASEPDKPVPSPKPRLTPKPFVVEKNPSIKPILAPKPQTKPRPESTRLAGYKPDLPNTPKPTPGPVLTNPNRPAPTSFKTPNKLNAGQTTKPVVQPFKPAPYIDLADLSKPTRPVAAERQKPAASSLVYSKSLKSLSAAEWSGNTQKEHENKQNEQNKGGTSMTRAKSMDFLAEVGQEKEKDKPQSELSVPMRPQPRNSRPRPVSALLLGSPTKTESPVPVPRWIGRRPLSADLTSKFESIGLSLHRKSPKGNDTENTPTENLPQKKEQDKSLSSSVHQSTEDVTESVHHDTNNKKTDEVTVKDAEQEKHVPSIKSRINLLLDSSSSPVTNTTGQDLLSPVQPLPEKEPAVGVKKLIKQLTEDVTPTQSPVVKPVLKPRPLPLDLTKRFSSERSPDLASISEDLQENSKDPQRGQAEKPAVTPNDQKMFLDLKNSPEQLEKASTSMFENVVEKESVLMIDQDKSANTTKDSLSSVSFKKVDVEDEGTLVIATYKEPMSPSSPLRVFHSFDTLQAVEENRAVSESIPAAKWEDKAMTLRARRSEMSRAALDWTEPAPVQPASTLVPDPQPRYLRIGALHKWTTQDFDPDTGLDKGTMKDSQREGLEALDKDQDKQRSPDQDEMAAAPKRFKMLQAEEQPKPRATYFALTGQIQEAGSPETGRTSFGGTTAHFDDLPWRSTLGGSQGKALPVRRNPSLEEAFGQTSQSHGMFDELISSSHMSSMEIRSQIDEETKVEITEAENKKEQKKKEERHRAKMKELEKEKEKPQEIEKRREQEWERDHEKERQRQKVEAKQRQLDKEKLKIEEMERLQVLEFQRQKQFEKERQQLIEQEKQKQRKKAEKEAEKLKQMALEQEMLRIKELEKEKARQKELEMERQLKIEREKQRELEKQRQRDLEREKELEKEKQRQKQEEKQRQLDKEKQQMEEMERIKEMERLQVLECQRQKQFEKEKQQFIELEKQRQREKAEKEAEKLRQMVLEQEMLRIKELEKEKARQKELEMERQLKIEREKQRELEKQRQRDLEREKQQLLDIERQQLENERLRREQEKEKQRKEELERHKEMERRQLLEFEKQKHTDREKQQFDLENQRLKEKMEKEAAENMRHIAKQQEAERQRLKEKQKKEEQERLRMESSALRPKVLDLDSVLRNDQLPKPSSPRSDPAARWREPYKPTILDIDSFSSQAQPSQSKDLFSGSGIQSLDPEFEIRSQSTHERDVTWKVPAQTSGGFSNSVWTSHPQDPWELRPVDMSVEKLMNEPKKSPISKPTPEELLFSKEERLSNPQRHCLAFPADPPFLAPSISTEPKTGISVREHPACITREQIWIPRELQTPKKSREAPSHRRSHGSQELNRMRSRSMSRRSAPSSSTEEANLSRMRSRSAHREKEHSSWEQQKQSSPEKDKGPETPVHETDSQYGTWETGLRSDDSLSPATPSLESNLSQSPKKPTPPHTPGDPTSQLETDTLDGVPPLSSSESQPLPVFPDAPTALLDNSVLRSRAQLGKKRAPRTRPSKATRQSRAQEEEGTSDDWLYRDSTELKAERKDDDSSEEKTRGADAGPAVALQPQRVALFPGVDPSALKAQLKKRSDSDNQTDGPISSPSHPSRTPKSPFLPRAARVLPPPGGKENSEEDSPQWLKELKSKKRLSQYESET